VVRMMALAKLVQLQGELVIEAHQQGVQLLLRGGELPQVHIGSDPIQLGGKCTQLIHPCTSGDNGATASQRTGWRYDRCRAARLLMWRYERGRAEAARLLIWNWFDESSAHITSEWILIDVHRCLEREEQANAQQKHRR
jgi:hypothetical protein